MDQRTLEALKGSIEKWRRIVYKGASNGGPEDCPLCQLFNTYEHKYGLAGEKCVGCPVMERTGVSGCEGSPYEKIENSFYVDPINEDPKVLKHAKAELAFLKSLLPPQEGP